MTFLCVFFEQILKITRFERKFSGNQQKYGATLFEQYKKNAGLSRTATVFKMLTFQLDNDAEE